MREGNTERVRLRNGKTVITRQWDSVGGEYKFTKQGDRFYKQLRRNYIVQLPVKIRGTRLNGSTYTIKSSMPIQKLGLTRKQLPLNLTHAERKATLKEMVEDELPLSGTLMQHSQEEYTYDESGGWAISDKKL